MNLIFFGAQPRPARRLGRSGQRRAPSAAPARVESIKTAAWANGERAITLSVQRQPGANTVAVVDAVRAAMPGLIAQMPASVELKLRNDRGAGFGGGFADPDPDDGQSLRPPR